MKTNKWVVVVVVGLLVFAAAAVLQWRLWQPEWQPKTLVADVWLPSAKADSALYSQFVSAGLRGKSEEVGFDVFRQTAFEESDVVEQLGPDSTSIPYLLYFGRRPEGTFRSAILSLDEILPSRSQILYSDDWRQSEFDRTTGKITVTRSYNEGGLAFFFLLIPAVLGVIYGLSTLAGSAQAIFSLVFVSVCGLLNWLALLVWSQGKPSYLSEASLWVFATGALAFWLFGLVWGFLTDNPSDSLLGGFAVSVMALAVGALIEALVANGFFSVDLSIGELLGLAGFLAVANLIVDVVIGWSVYTQSGEQKAAA